MFFIIGLGLGDLHDITLRGLDIVKRCRRVYLEAYTSVLSVGKEALQEFYGREIILADRELVEQNALEILNGADKCDVALLVVGDPFSATTHTDIALRAAEMKIPFEVVHNASIFNAVGCTGLQLYSFGETVSIPFWTDKWKPDSFYYKILGNLARGLHTLCLLDIRVKEPTTESLTRKKKEYEPPRFMSIAEAAKELLVIVKKSDRLIDKSDSGLISNFNENSKCVAVCRVGTPTQKIVAAPLRRLSRMNFGPPLHSLVIVGNLHPLEQEYLNQFEIKE